MHQQRAQGRGLHLQGAKLSLLALALSAISLSAVAACEVRSGPRTAALVELYTSEGCSSCPPADQQLSRLRQVLDPTAAVVPLSLHVGYWDYIGWKDPYALEAFSTRQSWLVSTKGQRTVYTPHFFVAGAEARNWRGELRDTVRQVNDLPAKADIHLQAGLTTRGALTVQVEATTRDGAAPAALYLAVTESGLASSVTRGENRGARLAHDHVVREWVGPLPLVAGATKVQREITLPAAWNRARLEVVAFVQDERTGSVLQAVSAQHCTGS
ncbi:MAG: DUF1223 domain-containing protein [Gammaproteobacteria bacterium]|nr:DUF1223 domain-containing protein [Rhodocyclaceae bacterium]MBU3908704.1 DUF1223 domain-containing protein [Gammaproteobacteria bacterium]MBU4004732.1 DUF1223 domain-containing protein [Gammaproteobacteria bacterium]MBU4021335.1 DUF1223 domain-containing protein [Gammaproteobacteria bacterium]MBU4096352.1 DUF1223 domain-containing protein [Gammaproteobacteria bacterium]